MSRLKSMTGITVLAATLVSIQLVATLLGREYYLTQLIMSAYYTVVLLGLCLVMGYAGQLSLGHGAFFAIGGYTSAFLTTVDLSSRSETAWARLLQRLSVLVTRNDLYGGETLSFSPWTAFLAGIVLTLVIALLIGYPALKLKGHYLAMGTLGFGLIVYRILLGSEFTGGADGISSVPSWHLLPALEICGRRSCRVMNYYVAWGGTLLVLLFVLNVVDSRTGRALRSIHGGEIAANAMGINTAGYKLKVFVISALLASVAGCMLTHYNGAIGPSEAGAMKSVRYVTLVAAGGMANVWGVLIVGTVLTFLSLRGSFGTMDHAVFGLILILIMSLAPQGPLKPLSRLPAMVINFLLRKQPPPPPVPTGTGGAAPEGEAPESVNRTMEA